MMWAVGDDDRAPVCLGGDRSNPFNYWPQPRPPVRKKDQLLLCSIQKIHAALAKGGKNEAAYNSFLDCAFDRFDRSCCFRLGHHGVGFSGGTYHGAYGGSFSHSDGSWSAPAAATSPSQPRLSTARPAFEHLADSMG